MQKTHLLGILQIYFQVLVAPHDARVLVGRGVRETIDGSRGATDDAPEVGALAVLATLCSSARRSRQTVRKSCMHSQTSVQETDRGRRCASEKYTDLSMAPPPHTKEENCMNTRQPHYHATYLVSVVALCALGLEDLGALLHVAGSDGNVRLGDCHCSFWCTRTDWTFLRTCGESLPRSITPKCN